MAKKPSTAMSLDAKSTPAQRESANRQHHQELVSHTLDAAEYNGHGHYVGQQGPNGHAMGPSDVHQQGEHAYIPQGVGFFARARPQNMASKDGSPSFDDDQSGAQDYGAVDKAD